MNPCNLVAVILKVLLVNLLAALNFANVLKKRLENKKNVNNVKNVTKIKKKRKNVFYTSTHLRTFPKAVYCSALRG